MQEASAVQSSIESLRATIASMEVSLKESHGLSKKLDAARNRLAQLTASVFVAVDGGNEITVYGVCTELKTRAQGLSLSLRGENGVEVTRHLTSDTVSFYISPGAQVSFKIEDLELEEQTIYHVRAFATNDEAKEWARQRLMANTSR